MPEMMPDVLSRLGPKHYLQLTPQLLKLQPFYGPFNLLTWKNERIFQQKVMLRTVLMQYWRFLPAVGTFMLCVMMLRYQHQTLAVVVFVGLSVRPTWLPTNQPSFSFLIAFLLVIFLTISQPLCKRPGQEICFVFLLLFNEIFVFSKKKKNSY